VQGSETPRGTVLALGTVEEEPDLQQIIPNEKTPWRGEKKFRKTADVIERMGGVELRAQR